MRVTRSPWSSSVAPKGRDHAGRTCLSAAHETGRPTAAGFRKPFHIRAFGPNAASGNPPALLPRQDDLKVLCSRDQVALSRRGRSGTASVEAVAYGRVGPVRLEPPAIAPPRRRASPPPFTGRHAGTYAETRVAWSQSGPVD